PVRVRFDDQCRPLRRVAATRHAGRRVRPACEAIAGRDDAAHAIGDPRGAGHRVRRHDAMTVRARVACIIAALTLGIAVAGCAPRSERIILLPEHDGRPTAVIVNQGGREVKLDQPYAAAELSYADPWSYRATEAEVNTTFKDALAAQPS